jgi:hypothetical protein
MRQILALLTLTAQCSYAIASNDFTWTVPSDGGDVYANSDVAITWTGGGVSDPSMGPSDDGPNDSPDQAAAPLRVVQPGVSIAKAEASAETTFDNNADKLSATMDNYARVLHFANTVTLAKADGHSKIKRDVKKKTSNGVVKIYLSLNSVTPFDKSSGGIASNDATMEARAGGSWWIARYYKPLGVWQHDWNFKQYPGGTIANATYASDTNSPWILPTGTALEFWNTTQTKECICHIPVKVHYNYGSGTWSVDTEVTTQLEASVQLEKQ